MNVILNKFQRMQYIPIWVSNFKEKPGRSEFNVGMSHIAKSKTVCNLCLFTDISANIVRKKISDDQK